MSRTSAGIQYNARSMNGIISIDAETITATNITTDIISATNLLEADTPETITALWTYNVLPQSSVVPTTGNQLVNKSYVDASFVSLAGSQTITGSKIIGALFTYSVLPQSTILPTSSNQFVIKDYVDSTFVNIGGTQNITGIKTFITNLPLSSIVPTTGNQFVNKTYVDGKFVDFSTNQSIIGRKTFTANLPQSSLVPSTGDDLVNKAYTDGTFVNISGTQSITGTKNFTTNLPISSIVPTTSNQFVNKSYVDGLLVGAFVDLTSAQSISGLKTFTTLPQSSIVPTTANQFVNKSYVDASFVSLEGAQTISGLKTFTTLPETSISATTANQFTNKTYVDGAITAGLSNYVDLTNTQTISGLKTFSVDVRLNNTRNLIFGTTTGGRIQYSPAGMFYDNQAGSSHFFFITGLPSIDINSNGLLVRTGKNIRFDFGSSITENSGGSSFDVNVPTSYQYNFKINSVNKFQIHPTFGTYIADNLNMTTQNYINWSGGSFQQEDTAGTQFRYNVPSGYKHSFTFNNVEALKISEDVDGVILSLPSSKIREEISFQNFLFDTSANFHYSFRIDNFDALRIDKDANGTLLSLPSGIVMREYTSFDWLLYQLPSGFTLKYQVAGNDIMEVSSGGALIYESLSMRNGKRVVWDEGFTNLAHIRKDTTTSTFDYEVASGYRHKFMVNSVSSAFIDASGVIINSTAVGAVPVPDKMLYLSANKANYIGSTTTDMRYNCSGSGSHNFYRNDTTYLGFINNLGMTLSPNNASLQLGTTSTAQIKHDTATTELQYRTTGSYEHMFYIDGSLWYEMRTDTFRALRGYQNKLGATGAYVSNNFNFSWNNPVAGLSVWIDTTRLGTMTISDYRVKECIVPARPVLERLCQVKMIEYEHKNISIFKKSGRHHGFIAHEFQELFPELNNIIAGEKDALTDDGKVQPQSIQPELTNLYLSAIQELNAKIEAQQKQIDQLIVLFSSRMV